MTFNLNEWLGKYAGWRILRRLAMNPAEAGVNALARELGLSPAKCSQALRELEVGGLLASRSVGTSRLYSMADTRLAREVRRFHGVLSVMESGVAERLADENPDMTVLALYGSLAGGDFDGSSDVDILMLTPSEFRSDPAALGDLVGRDVNVKPLSLAEWLDMRGTPFHASVSRRHAVLYGGDLP